MLVSSQLQATHGQQRANLLRLIWWEAQNAFSYWLCNKKGSAEYGLGNNDFKN